MIRIMAMHESLDIEDLTARLKREAAARLEAERQLEALRHALDFEATRAAESRRAKSDFLRNMSLELRTPLHSIIGFASLTLERLRGRVEGADLENLQIVHDSARSLMRLINQTLEMSRLQSDDYVFEPNLVPVEELLRACVDIRQPQMAEAGIRAILDVGRDLPDVVGDRAALTKCMLIFIDNAIGYSNGAPEFLIAADRAGNAVEILIADRGIGIPEEYLEKVTEPFVQVDNRLSKQTGGAGLGLAIARALLEKQGGKLRITSHLGHGTTVHVHLRTA
jgi:signal transduction histidine kinase